MFCAAVDAPSHAIAYARSSCHDRKDDLEPRDRKRLRAAVTDGEVGRPVTSPRTGGPEAERRVVVAALAHQGQRVSVYYGWLAAESPR